MADFEDSSQRLETALQDIETSISGTEAVSSTFRVEVEEMTRSMALASKQATGLSKSVGTSLRSAFDSLIVDGDKLSNVVGKLGSSIASKAFSSALTPVTDALGAAVTGGVSSLVAGFMPFKNGGAISAGRVRAFANGGVVDGPTSFSMRGGSGLMGEAGPEAIMPLARGADGKLGVRTGGGGSAVHVTMNISTPDAESFQRSKTQVAAQLTRAISRGNRNL